VSSCQPVTSSPAAAARYNVLFLIVDDLRPDVGPFAPDTPAGRLISTPAIDRLAEGALVFDRAYVQYSYCSPSRNSFMSGRNPDTSRVWNFGDHFREAGVGADWLSLPQFFKQSGFLTVGAGKLFHPGWPPRNDMPQSWSPGYDYLCPECSPEWPGLQRHDGLENGAHACLGQVPNCSFAPPLCFGPTVCVANTSKDEAEYSLQLEDQRITDRCIALLRNASHTDTLAKFPNFFVGCGVSAAAMPCMIVAAAVHSLRTRCAMAVCSCTSLTSPGWCRVSSSTASRQWRRSH
jgi:hypothetical protein